MMKVQLNREGTVKTFHKIRINFRKLFIAFVVPLFAITTIFVQMAMATTYTISGALNLTPTVAAEGASVYVTAPSSNAILYGPVVTNSVGSYSLQVGASGTYDIHYVPPTGTGVAKIVDSSVAVSSNQTINKTFSAITRTLSGTLKDKDGNPMPSVKIKLNNNNSWQSTTNSNGEYSISAPAGKYYLHISRNGGDLLFTLSQQSSGTPINLLHTDQVLNMTIKTVSIDVAAYANSFTQMVWFTNMTADARSGVTSLYPGDPGTNIVYAGSYSGSIDGNWVTVPTIAGAVFTAPGLEATSATGSICHSLPGSSPTRYDCLRTPLTANSDVTLEHPSEDAAVRTFSGTLTDGNGNPISGARIFLWKYNDNSPNDTTDASGNFSISAVPKQYALEVKYPANSNWTLLTQNKSNPTIDLRGGDVVQNLQVPTVTLTVSAFDEYGNPAYSKNVTMRTDNGTVSLYTGDPGFSIAAPNVSKSTTSSNNIVTFDSVVGASFLARGLSSPVTTNSICVQASPYYNCLTSAYSVTGSASLNAPQ